ncbi:L-ascorbate oxidase homolog [Linum perenne]
MAEEPRSSSKLLYSLCLFFLLALRLVNADSPYRFYTWKVTYGNIYPLGVKQQGILINGQFPGPHIDAVTNDNIVINVYNYIKEPFLLSWNGIQHRRNSWQDGVYGTNCPIRPGRNFTYILQFKDQIGTFFYFPSLGFHKAAGGFGSIRVWSRPRIPVPFPPPAGDFVLLAGDWYKTNHYILRRYLNAGRNLPMPDGLLINGRGWNGNTFRVDPGQSYSVLVTADQPAKDYYIVVSTRFTTRVLTTTSILHYSNSRSGVSGPIPGAPTTEINWSLNQARTIRRNLTASGPRPNPQGSYHYGMIKPTRTITLANSAPYINGKQRYAVNSVSFVPALTPLKLADYFNIPGVFNVGSIPMKPTWGNAYLQTSVMGANFREYVEIIFQNWEDSVQSWHIDGHAFFVVGMDGGQWTPYSRMRYNLRDTVSRCTVQVYPRAWTAIYMALDNVGMWNIRSENWARQYLGQQLYLRVYSASRSWRDELPIPKNALLCGRARGRHTRPL